MLAYADSPYVKDKSGNKKYGTPSNVVAVNVSKATSAISNLKLVEKTPDGYVFSYDGTVRKEEDVEFWYSESPEFVNDYKVTDCISGENIIPGHETNSLGYVFTI